MIADTAGLRIVLVGCGGWGKLILRDLKLLGAHVVVVGRSEATRARALAYGADAAVPGIGALTGRFDGAVIATLSDSHAEVALELLPIGVPVFIEKPLAASLEGARAVVASYPGRAFVMEKWRYHPAIERLRLMVADGSLGTPLGISTTRLGWSMTHSELDPVWNLLPHDLAIVDHILTFLPAPTAAFVDPLGPPGSGLLAHLGRAGEETATSIHVSANHPVNRRSVVVSGTRGVATLSGSYDTSLTVRIGKPGARDAVEKLVPVEDGPLPLFAELQRFLLFLRGGSPPLAPAEESIRIVESIVQLRRMAGL